MSDMTVGDVCPKRFGLNYDPPSIILEYLQVSTGKLFHRRIGLRRLRANSDPARVAEKLRQKNKALLAEDRVSFEQIVSLVSRLQEGPLKREAAQGDKAKARKGMDDRIDNKAGGDNRNENIDNKASGDDRFDDNVGNVGNVDYHKMNLNKLSPEEVLKHKAKMDIAFFQNQKKPGDPGYVYDKQVDFQTDEQMDNDWDSEEDLDDSAGADSSPGA
uniref:Centrosomal protein of 19 kDa n=1 Tax=Alexandrium catenella TaxID=2925 RepID=A0A7S1LUL0_ALECA